MQLPAKRDLPNTSEKQTEGNTHSGANKTKQQKTARSNVHFECTFSYFHIYIVFTAVQSRDSTRGLSPPPSPADLSAGVTETPQQSILGGQHVPNQT